MRTWARVSSVVGLLAAVGCSRCGEAPKVVDAGPPGPALTRVTVPVASDGRAMIRVDVTRDGIELDLDGADEGWAPAWREDAKARQVEFTPGRHPITPIDQGLADGGEPGADGPLLTALQNTLAMESRYGAPQSQRARRVDLLVNPDVPPETLSRVWGALAQANVSAVGLSVRAGDHDGVLEVLLPQVPLQAEPPQLGGPLSGVAEDAPLRAQLGATFTGAFRVLPEGAPDEPWRGAFFAVLGPDGARWAELGHTAPPPGAPASPDALRSAVEKSLELRKGHAEPESHTARLTVLRGTGWTAWVQGVAALQAPTASGALSPVWVAWAGK